MSAAAAGAPSPANRNRQRIRSCVHSYARLNVSFFYPGGAATLKMGFGKTIEVTSSEAVTIYSISFEMDCTMEFEKFVQEFESNATLNRHLNYVLAALGQILEKGALERFFRPEGKIADNVQALPIDKCKLRLYCLRLSDEVIIIGNGGEKDVQTYEQSSRLNGYVMELQKFYALLKREMLKGTITIEGRDLTGIEDKVFKI